MSPREANRLDPNQRLLLELAYETFMDAGITLENMSGSRCGVYIGVSATDFNHFQFQDTNSLDAHSQTGLNELFSFFTVLFNHYFFRSINFYNCEPAFILLQSSGSVVHCRHGVFFFPCRPQLCLPVYEVCLFTRCYSCIYIIYYFLTIKH
jgi:hypothetical protein